MLTLRLKVGSGVHKISGFCLIYQPLPDTFHSCSCMAFGSQNRPHMGCYGAASRAILGGDEPMSTTAVVAPAVVMVATEAAEQVATVTVSAAEAAKELITVTVKWALRRPLL